MTIKTRYSIGDEVQIGGAKHKVIAVHLYESETTHTERYYFGGGLWITMEKGVKEI